MFDFKSISQYTYLTCEQALEGVIKHTDLARFLHSERIQRNEWQWHLLVAMKLLFECEHIISVKSNQPIVYANVTMTATANKLRSMCSNVYLDSIEAVLLPDMGVTDNFEQLLQDIKYIYGYVKTKYSELDDDEYAEKLQWCRLNCPPAFRDLDDAELLDLMSVHYERRPKGGN